MYYWNEILLVPAKTILAQVSQFIVSVLLVLLLLIVGWAISTFIIKAGVTRLLKILKLDELADRIELTGILSKGGVKYSLSELVGETAYWLSILITFVVALNAAGLTIAADLLQRIGLFVPNVIAAIFILIAGMFLAVVMRNIVITSASNAGFSQVNLFGKITEIVIGVFAVAMALEQLQIGAMIIQMTVTIILGSLGLGFALAFGLGCKDIVGKSVEKILQELKK
jgi:hypothetical protein